MKENVNGPSKPAVGVVEAAGVVPKCEEDAAELRTRVGTPEADAAAPEAQFDGSPDTAAPGANHGALWMMISLSATLLLIVGVGVANSGNAMGMLGWWGLSAAFLASVAAVMRLIAHDGSKELDRGGKMFGLAASVLALCATGALLFVNLFMDKG